MKFLYTHEKKSGEVTCERNGANLTIKRGQRSTTFTYTKTPTGYRLLHQGQVFDTSLFMAPDRPAEVFVNGERLAITWQDLRQSALSGQGQGKAKESQVRAIMPGRVSKLYVKAGDEIKTGDPLLVLEAMKMENEIKSNQNGVIEKVAIAEGASVETGAVLITFAQGEM